MEPTTTINVLMERDGEWWIAQCLQHDLVAQARSLPELHAELVRFLSAHIESCEERGVDPFKIPPAPKQFWAKYEATPAATATRESITTGTRRTQVEARIRHQ